VYLLSSIVLLVLLTGRCLLIGAVREGLQSALVRAADVLCCFDNVDCVALTFRSLMVKQSDISVPELAVALPQVLPIAGR